MDGEQVQKLLIGDIHEEVESQNRFLNQMGNDMDMGIMSGTMDRFRMVWTPDLLRVPRYFMQS